MTGAAATARTKRFLRHPDGGDEVSVVIVPAADGWLDVSTVAGVPIGKVQPYQGRPSVARGRSVHRRFRRMWRALPDGHRLAPDGYLTQTGALRFLLTVHEQRGGRNTSR